MSLIPAKAQAWSILLWSFLFQLGSNWKTAERMLKFSQVCFSISRCACGKWFCISVTKMLQIRHVLLHRKHWVALVWCAVICNTCLSLTKYPFNYTGSYCIYPPNVKMWIFRFFTFLYFVKYITGADVGMYCLL